jgi:hypothetical protein
MEAIDLLTNAIGCLLFRPRSSGNLEGTFRETGTVAALGPKRTKARILIIGTGNTGWTNVWRYGDDTNYHMTNLGGTYRTLDNVDGRCELEQGILSQVSAPTPSVRFRISDPFVCIDRMQHGMKRLEPFSMGSEG